MNSIESSTARTPPDRPVRELGWSAATNLGATTSNTARREDTRWESRT